jgi:hypothetical protein
MELSYGMFDEKGNGLGFFSGQTRSSSGLILRNAYIYNERGERVGDGDLGEADVKILSKLLNPGEILIVLAQIDVCANIGRQSARIKGATGDKDFPGIAYIARYGCLVITNEGAFGIVERRQIKVQFKEMGYVRLPVVSRREITDHLLWVATSIARHYVITEEVVAGENLRESLADLITEVRKTRKTGDGWRVLIRTFSLANKTYRHYEILPEGLTVKGGVMPYLERSNYAITLTREEEATVEGALAGDSNLTLFRII